jgi:hypothetical protein
LTVFGITSLEMGDKTEETKMEVEKKEIKPKKEDEEEGLVIYCSYFNFFSPLLRQKKIVY